MRSLFGSSVKPAVTLKALCYFEDGDLASLKPGIKRLLEKSASLVVSVPKIQIKSKKLC